MLQVGITGGIGSGKSTVCKIFEVLGVPVYYADDAARRLMNEEPLRSAIIKEFGPAAYTDQQLDRSYISTIVFNDQVKLAALNQLVHPVTINDAANWMARQQSGYALKEAALIFESGADKQLDYVIGVSAPLELRMKRIIERDHITAEVAAKKIGNQMNEEEKMKRCNFVLINDEQTLLTPQVISLHEKLLELSSKTK